MNIFRSSFQDTDPPQRYCRRDLGFRAAVLIGWYIISAIALFAAILSGNSRTLFLFSFEAGASIFIFFNSSKRTIIRNFLVFAAFLALVFTLCAVIGNNCPEFLDRTERSSDMGIVFGLPAGLGAGAFCQLAFYPIMKKRRFCIPVTSVCTEIISDSGARLTKTMNPALREAMRTGTGYARAWLKYEYGGRTYLCETQRISRIALPDIGDTVVLLLDKNDPMDFRYVSFASHLRLTGGLVGAMIFLVMVGFYVMTTLTLPALPA